MASGTVRPGDPPAEPRPIKPVSDPLHERKRLHPITRLPILNKILAKEVRTNIWICIIPCWHLCEEATALNFHQADESEQSFQEEEVRAR
jgi:hypothetical protein